jgi:predicted metal-dependent hydrolase
MKAAKHASITLAGRKVEYRVVRSKAAQKIRIRVGPNGVEVLQPAEREDGDVTAFLRANGEWICGQLLRVAGLNGVRKPERPRTGEFLYRGVPTPIAVETDDRRRGVNCVLFENGGIHLLCGRRTPPSRTLENWLRRQARAEIERYLGAVTNRLRRSPGKLYIMANGLSGVAAQRCRIFLSIGGSSSHRILCSATL